MSEDDRLVGGSEDAARLLADASASKESFLVTAKKAFMDGEGGPHAELYRLQRCGDDDDDHTTLHPCALLTWHSVTTADSDTPVRDRYR